jgi:cation diffusion facilitator family transporter
VVVVIAANLSSRKADKEHPFGHGRWEEIAALLVAMFLGIIAYEFLKDSISRLGEKKDVTFGAIAIIITIVSIVAKEALAQYAFYLGKKTDNGSVKADGWHHRSDALSSVVVLAGILLAKFNSFWWIDGVLGIVIALMLFYATFEIMKEATNKLLGQEPSRKLIDDVTKEIVEIYGNDLKTHHFHVHNYVLHKELTLHIKLKKDLTIEAGHKIASEIESMILQKFDINATIHMEPL